MIIKTSIVLVSVAAWCECAYVYSSFWAPLYEPRLLGYRVDAAFLPEAGREARALYRARYGHRGEHLVAGLGNGGGPGGVPPDNEVYGAVKFYYTYPGANNNN